MANNKNAGRGFRAAASSQFARQQQARLYASALLVAAVIALRPLTFFLDSAREFGLRVDDVEAYATQVFLVFSGFLLAACLPFSAWRLARARAVFTALLLALAVMLWLQGNFFTWNYGSLNGRPLDFAGNTLHGWFEAACWGAVFALFLWQREKVVPRCGVIVLIVLASLLAGVVQAYGQVQVESWDHTYQANTDSYFTFSSQQNVIVLVIDSARSDVFADMLPGLTPAEKATFDGFTFFRNTTGTFNATDPAVSGILTGQLYDFSTWRDNAYQRMFTSDTSVPYRLKQAGFRTEVYPYSRTSVHLAPDFIDNLTRNAQQPPEVLEQQRDRELEKLALVVRFNFSPHFLKHALFDSAAMYGAAAPSTPPPGAPSDDPAKEAKDAPLPPAIVEHLNYNRWILAQFGPRMKLREQPVFKYLHYHGGHPPFFHDEHYRGMRLPFTLESYQRQYKGALLLTVGALVQALKEHGVYDRTMLVVMGDHGVYVPRADQKKPAASDLDVVPDTLRPLLMVKPFGAVRRPLAISSAPVRLFDVPATIFDALHITSSTTGRSVFSVGEHENRPRLAYSLELSEHDPELEGALIYRVDGDVADRASWKLQRSSLALHRGEVELPLEQLQEARDNMIDYLNDPGRSRLP